MTPTLWAIVFGLLAASMGSALLIRAEHFGATAVAPETNLWDTGNIYDRESYAAVFYEYNRHLLLQGAYRWTGIFLTSSAVPFGLMSIGGGLALMLFMIGIGAVVVGCFPLARVPAKLRKSRLHEKTTKLGPYATGFSVTVSEI